MNGSADGRGVGGYEIDRSASVRMKRVWTSTHSDRSTKGRRQRSCNMLNFLLDFLPESSRCCR
jgi:hypothetical protein